MRTRSKNTIRKFLTKNIGGWVLLIPTLLLFSFFVWIPTIQNIRMSFYNVKGFTTLNFAGFQKYLEVFRDAWFLSALKNTLLYSLYSVIIGFLLPIIFGFLMSELIHMKSFFKVGIYIPNVIPGIASVLMFSIMFSPENWGLMNSILNFFGIKAQLWFDNTKTVIPLIVTTLTWKGAGATALIYLAAFQNVDQSLYEAAALDGAGIFKRIIKVSLPTIMPMIRMLFILQIISVFQISYEPMVLAGTSSHASVSLIQLVYYYAFESVNRSSNAAALGAIVTVILVSLSLVYMKFTSFDDSKRAAKRTERKMAKWGAVK